MRSTIMDIPLTITSIMRYGTSMFGDCEVVTYAGDGVRRRTYAEAGRRAARLANALRRLGVDADQRVGTFMWNNAEHLEAYLAVPSMGAVLHTLNIRLAPAEVGYIATIDPWNVPGRYGWVGGTGTSAHITPSAGTVAILLTQVAADGPVAPQWMRDFWQYAAG